MKPTEPVRRGLAHAGYLEVASPEWAGGEDEVPSRFSREGLLWAAATACLFVTGLFKAINLLLLLAYLLLGLLVANAFLSRRALRGLRARRLSPGPIVAGRPVTWRVEVANAGNKPARGWALREAGPRHALNWFVLRLEPGSSADLRCTVTLPVRGRYRCEPLRAWTRYPFGLTYHVAELAPAEERVVLPRLGTVHGDRLRHWLARATRGDGRVHRRLRHVAAQEADVHGLRSFRPGDSPRWIHWKTSARRNEWMVREFEDSAAPHLVLVAEPWMPERPLPSDRVRLEKLISLAGSVCREWCREAGSRLSLVIAGRDAAVLTGATGPEYLLRLLEALALAEGGPAVEPETWLPHVGRVVTSPVLVLSSRPGAELAGRVSALLGRPAARLTAGENVPWYNEPTDDPVNHRA